MLCLRLRVLLVLFRLVGVSFGGFSLVNGFSVGLVCIFLCIGYLVDWLRIVFWFFLLSMKVMNCWVFLGCLLDLSIVVLEMVISVFGFWLLK